MNPAREKYASRLRQKDASLWRAEKSAQDVIASSLGWLHCIAPMRARADALRDWAGRAAAEYERVILLGMGGASLAAAVFAAVFARRLCVLDGTHPRDVLRVADSDLRGCLFVVASKSGGTVETLDLYAFFRARLAAQGADADAHFIFITDAGTPLHRLAESRRARKIFLGEGDIGGRFSALSHFGIVPAALLGVDVGEVLSRAQSFAESTKPDSPAENPALALGLSLGHAALAGRDKLMLLLPPHLAAFGMWVEQLVAESCGKDGRGILPVAGAGAGECAGDDRICVRIGGGDGGGGDSVTGSARESFNESLNESRKNENGARTDSDHSGGGSDVGGDGVTGGVGESLNESRENENDARIGDHSDGGDSAGGDSVGGDSVGGDSVGGDSVGGDSVGNDGVGGASVTGGARDSFNESLNESRKSNTAPRIAHTLPLADPLQIGAEFFRWQFATAIAAAVLRVNPFDQPDVQRAKSNTRGFLEKRMRIAPPVARTDAYDLHAHAGSTARDAHALFAAFCEQLTPPKYLALLAYVAQDDAHTALLQNFRARIAMQTGVAVTLGFGPRYLHSTGQLHKGGARNGCFVQLLAGAHDDIGIPQREYTFGELHRAQADGDFHALLQTGAPVLRAHLKADTLRSLAAFASEFARHCARTT